MVCMPVFDIGGVAWIKSLHGGQVKTHPVRLMDYKARVLTHYDSTDDAFQAMDVRSAGLVDLEDFIRAAKQYDPPLSAEQAEQVFRGLDSDEDELLSPEEFAAGLQFNHFSDNDTAGLVASVASAASDLSSTSAPTLPLASTSEKMSRPAATSTSAPAAKLGAAAPVRSALASSVKAGASEISVADESIFHVGDVVTFSNKDGSRYETVTVIGFGSVQFEPPLKYSYDAGSQVSVEHVPEQTGTNTTPGHRSTTSTTHKMPKHNETHSHHNMSNKSGVDTVNVSNATNFSATTNTSLTANASANITLNETATKANLTEAPSRKATAPAKATQPNASKANSFDSKANSSTANASHQATQPNASKANSSDSKANSSTANASHQVASATNASNVSAAHLHSAKDGEPVAAPAPSEKAPAYPLPMPLAPVAAEDNEGEATPEVKTMSFQEFRDSMGENLKDSPRDAFAAIDKDGDGFSKLDEFSEAAKAFERALTMQQAKDVFAHLDNNSDGKVGSMEFLDAFKRNHWPAPITLEEYRERVRMHAQVATILAFVPDLDFDGLSDAQLSAVRKAVVQTLASLSGLPESSVRDEDDHAASVQLSSGSQWSSGAAAAPYGIVSSRRLIGSGSGLLAKAHIDVPAGQLSDDIVSVLTSASARKALAKQLSNADGLDKEIHSSSIEMAAVKENTDAFVKLDSDKDGALSEDEFKKVAQSLQPPLTKEEFDFVFAGLDRDGDGALSPHEFHAYGMNAFSEADATTPDAATHVDAKHATSTSPIPEPVKHGSDQSSQVTMEEFRRSMGPVAPGEAFDFIDADHDDNINLADLRQRGKAFTPPLGGSRAEFAFHGLDKDGNDKVTKKEFVDAINAGSFSQGEKPGAPNASTTEPVASTTATTAKPLQRKMMTGSGSPITIPEFLDRLAAVDSSATQLPGAVGVGQRDLHDDHPHVLFAALDGDGDGAVLPQEFGASKGVFNPPLSDLEAAGAFNDLDGNHDGQVTAAEFDDAVAKAGKHGGSASSADQVMDANAQIAFGDGRFLVNGGKTASKSQPEFTLADFVERSKTAFGSPEAAVAFKGLDLDQDGMVSAAEYAKAAAQSPAPEDELTVAKFKERMGAASPDLVFQTMDADGDDGVTLDEMMTARSAFSPQLSESQAEHAFAGLDADSDLVVRKKDLMKALEQEQWLAGNTEASTTALEPAAPGAGDASSTGTPITAKEFKTRMASTSLEEAFQALDLDHNGFVDMNEFAVSTKAFVPPLTTVEAIHAFNGLDKDQDGKVSSKEFTSVINAGKFVEEDKVSVEEFAQRLQGNFESIEEAIRMMDSDADGTLSREEFNMAVRKLAHPLSAEQADQAFAGLDSDSDNRISSDEAIAILQGGKWADKAKHEARVKAEEALAKFDLRKRMGTVSLSDAFKMLDEDKAKSLTREELTEGRKAFVPPLSEDDAKDVFVAMDADGDGEVSYDEFVKALGDEEATAQQAKKSTSSHPKKKPTTSRLRGKDAAAATTTSPQQAEQVTTTSAEIATTVAAATETITETTTSFVTSTATFPFPTTRTEVTSLHSGNKGKGLRGAGSSKSKMSHKEAPTSTSSKPYDCSAGFSNWEDGWSDGKKRWCCDHEQMGCEEGPITMRQFMDRLRSSAASPPEAMTLCDEDGNGAIGAEEFSDCVGKLKKPLSKKEAEYAFQGLDANGDFKITSSEFMSALKSERYFHEVYFTTTSTTTLGPALTFSDLQDRLGGSGSPRNAFFEMDRDDDESLTLKEFSSRAKTFSSPLSEKRAEEAFHGLDADKDGKVSLKEFLGAFDAGEFYKKGSVAATSLGGGAKKEARTEATVTTSAKPADNKTTAAVKEADKGGKILSDKELAAYHKVPAIASGTAELALALQPDADVPSASEVSKAVGDLFKAELGEQLGLHVTLASVESVRDETTGGNDCSVLMMWTADAKDGGAIQAKLQRGAKAIEEAIESRVSSMKKAPWMKGAKVGLWLSCSLDFYGERAEQLPRGTKLVRELGQLEDPRAAHSLATTKR